MDTGIVWYGIGALLLFLFVRRFLRMRSLTQYSPADVEALQKSAVAPLLLDVRNDSERRSGSIKGSIHIPIGSLRSRMNELEKYKGREIVCYCASGSRSGSAALLLNRHGFKAGNLRGGIGEWNFAHR